MAEFTLETRNVNRVEAGSEGRWRGPEEVLHVINFKPESECHVKALFGLEFRKFVTPGIIRISYILTMVVLGIGYLAITGGAFRKIPALASCSCWPSGRCLS